MKLIRLSYKEEDWELENILFESVSLIVGKNSTGKSKTLTTIDLLGKILTQKINLSPRVEWCIGIKSNKNEIITYTFRTSANDEVEVIFEEVKIDDKVVLLRDNTEKAVVYNELDKKDEDIYPPTTKLAIHTNRDIKKYPYFEDIALWAEQSYGFKFGNISPDKPFSQQKYNLLTTVEEIPELYKSLENETKSEIQKTIIDNLKIIGFDINELFLIQVDSKSSYLFIRENDVKSIIFFSNLSQGLFRCLSLLIFLEFLIAKRKPASIIIDDLCEGLDYERATKLGKLVFDKCLENDIQLIATSNDAFLMEAVDLKYWNVLQRSGSVVTSINHTTNPKLFEDFKFTGLSNFDFFSSDYIAQKK